MSATQTTFNSLVGVIGAVDDARDQLKKRLFDRLDDVIEDLTKDIEFELEAVTDELRYAIVNVIEIETVLHDLPVALASLQAAINYVADVVGNVPMVIASRSARVLVDPEEELDDFDVDAWIAEHETYDNDEPEPAATNEAFDDLDEFYDGDYVSAYRGVNP